MINYEVNLKIQEPISLEKGLKRANISATVLKKSKYTESAVVKLDSIFSHICYSKPLIYETNSFIIFKGSLSTTSFIYSFLNDYLRDAGRFTLSLLSFKKSQIDFVFQDYNFLSNFLKLNYDFFGWKHSVRVTLSTSYKENVLKMLLLSLPIL
jgi:hypothetical protein